MSEIKLQVRKQEEEIFKSSGDYVRLAEDPNFVGKRLAEIEAQLALLRRKQRSKKS